MITFGEKLVAIRGKFGITQEELGERLRVSRQTITKWETNVAVPDTMHVKDMAKLFGVTIDHLLDNKSELPLLVMREQINLNMFEKPATKERMTKKDSYMNYRFNGSYSVWPLARVKKMNWLEQVFDFLIGSGALEMADLLTDATTTRYYLLERNDVQLLVSLTSEYLEMRELGEKFSGKKLAIGSNIYSKGRKFSDN